jgi:hypothetical protein
MPIKTAVLWCLLLASVSGACDGLRLPRAPAEGTSAAREAPAPRPEASAPRRRAAKSGDGSSADQAENFGRIRSGLRRLVAAEETFFAENGTYTEDIDRLRFKSEDGTELRFLWLSVDGWAASGTHRSLPGRDCVIYVGRRRSPPTTLKYVRHGKEGVPVCDAPQPPPRPSTPAPAAPAKTANAAGEGVGRDSAASDTASALDAVNPTVMMKVDLRNLVRSQQTFFAQQGVYSRSTEPFALQYLWHRGVSVAIVSADVESWAARATHTARPGKSCVIWFGPVPTHPVTTASGRVPDRPGIPACDD